MRYLVVALLCCCALLTAGGSVSAAPLGRATTPVDWPQLLRDPAHSSLGFQTKIGASSASQLGVNWMSALRAADLGSPVAAYSTAFKKNVVVVGDERGDVTMFDEASGASLWSTSVGFGDSERATPMIAPDGSVWAATSYGATLWKLDGATGNVLCSAKEAIHFDASPSFVTPAGGVPTVFIATNGAATLNGPTLAIRESDCKTIWSFTKYLTPAGAWVEPAYGVDVHGRPLIFEGTDDPDSTLYALDANTGKLVWHFSIYNPPPSSYDIGAAATTSAPGVNGFADGVVYQPSKYGIMYALDLTTGKEIWETNFDKLIGGAGGGRSSAALVGNTLVFGTPIGAIALNATTGAMIWNFKDPTRSEVLSSPAVIGGAGNGVAAFGDAGGMFHVLRLTDGVELYNYQTASYITSSPAAINGHLLIDSTDGFLYDFALGGGNVASPTTTISTPLQGQKLPNPNGSFQVTGSAADSTGLAAVEVSVQAGGPAGPWYDWASKSWVPGAVSNLVRVQQVGQAQSPWSFKFPVPAAGSTYQVFANAVDVKGQADRTGAQPTFSILPSTTEPTIATSELFVAPGDTFTATGNAFAPGETVAYTLQGARVGTAVVGSDGAIPPVTITVPTTDAFGLTNLTATGQTSGKSSTAPLNISNVWSGFGYGASRTSYEPNDLVLQQTLQATSHGYVARAWLYLTGAAVDASPAIAAGYAYVGNDAGQMAAVDTISGAPMWTYTTPTGEAIHASPAVDINAGLLFFGSDDSVLYTLSSSTGKFIGSAKLDGIPTAPAFTSGRLYVGTDAGSLFAFNEKTGKLIWLATLSDAIHAAPSIDASKSIVIAGDDAGTLTARNSATGAALWTFTTGGAITAPAAISGGFVYVGSSDGKLYVLNETTGKLSYSFAAGSAIHAGVAIAGSSIELGTSGGVLYDLTLGGTVNWSNSIYANPIVGLGSVSDVPWVEMATGAVGASKDDQGGRQVYLYQTGAGLTTAPAIVNGAVYVGAEDGGLYAFTPYGFAPRSSRINGLVAAHLAASPPAPWTSAVDLSARAVGTRSSQPFGPRDFPMHLDRPGAASTMIGALNRTLPQSARSYLIDWRPVAAPNAPQVGFELQALRGGGVVAGAAVDTTAYPRRFDDAAVQREIARQIASHGWPVDANAQVIVVTGALDSTHSSICAYHSAFDLGANLARPVPYAVVPRTPAAGCDALGSRLSRVQAEMRVDPFNRRNASGSP